MSSPLSLFVSGRTWNFGFGGYYYVNGKYYDGHSGVAKQSRLRLVYVNGKELCFNLNATVDPGVKIQFPTQEQTLNLCKSQSINSDVSGYFGIMNE